MMPAAPPFDRDVLLSALDEAVDALLRVQILIGGVEEIDVPQEALDAAMTADPEVQQSRRTMSDVLRSLQDQLGPARLDLVLETESAANDLGARSADVAYKVGLGQRIHSH